MRERLRGQRISARTDDPEALARLAFMLIDIAVAVLLRQGQEAGRTEGEARADAIEWVTAQVAHMEIELLESGAVFNPAASVLGFGGPGVARLRPVLRGSWQKMPTKRQLLLTAGSARAAARADHAHYTGAVAEYSKICLACVSPDEHDDWNAEERGETPLQRADRAYGEILQEVRVAQTGVQILFAFLLTLAFTNRFTSITEFQKYVYVLTLMLSAAAAALLIAPAAFHRVVYRRRLKQHLVHAASRLALAGLVLLLLAMVSALLLILDVVTGLGPAILLAAGAMSWFIAWWFVLPAWKRLRHQGHHHLRHAPGPQRSRESPTAEMGGGPARTVRSAADGATGSDQRAEEPAPFSGPDAAGVTPLTASQHPASPADAR